MFGFLLLCLKNDTAAFTDGDAGGYCNGDIQCKDSNSICSNNICQCINGYMAVSGVCIEGNILLGLYIASICSRFSYADDIILHINSWFYNLIYV